MRYFFITFIRKPNGRIDEAVTVGKRIRDSDLVNSNVIIDFAESKVVKCVVEGKVHDTTFDKLTHYYKQIYPDVIAQLEKEAAMTAKTK